MSEQSKNKKFAILFKKFRLRSEIESLSEFGNLFADEGMVYETSLFTRWQNGERVPRDRKALLVMIKIFCQRGGLHTVEEANEILLSVNQRDLTKDEVTACGINPITEDIHVEEKLNSIRHGGMNENNYLIVLKKIFPWSSISITLLLLYIFIVLWWIRINIYDIRANDEIYLFEAIYALLALIGSVNGFLISKKYGGWFTLLGRSLFFFSLGLLGLWFGQTVWSYYNIVARVELPYPSLADIGFVSIIPFYILGSVYLARSAGIGFEVKSPKDIIIIVFTPIILFLFTYVIFVQNLVFDLAHPIRLFLDFMYSLGEAFTISLITIIYILSSRSNMRKEIKYLVFALVFQYITDATFLYIAANGYYYNGGPTDLLLATSFFIMSLTLIKISNNFNRSHNKSLIRQGEIYIKRKERSNIFDLKHNFVFLKYVYIFSAIVIFEKLLIYIKNNKG